MLKDATAFYARTLGVPNKCGPLITPLPGGFPSQNTNFPGLSAIVDGNGKVRAALGGEAGVIVADVKLDGARKVTAWPKVYGRWALPLPWFAFCGR